VTWVLRVTLELCCVLVGACVFVCRKTEARHIISVKNIWKPHVYGRHCPSAATSAASVARAESGEVPCVALAVGDVAKHKVSPTLCTLGIDRVTDRRRGSMCGLH